MVGIHVITIQTTRKCVVVKITKKKKLTFYVFLSLILKLSHKPILSCSLIRIFDFYNDDGVGSRTALALIGD